MVSSYDLVVYAALSFLMVAGFAAMEAGFSRAKNVSNTILKCTAGFMITIPAFLLIGRHIAFPGGAMDGAAVLGALACAAAVCVFSGALVERIRFSVYCAVSFVLSAAVYPLAIAGFATLSAKLPVQDVSGWATLSTVGGFSALMGAKILGPRIGKYSKGGVSRAMPGHNIPLSLLGMLVLLCCILGFSGVTVLQAGSGTEAMVRCMSNLLLSASLAGLSALATSWARYKRPDITMVASGMLAGMLAGSAGCHESSYIGTAIVAAVVGFIIVFSVENMDQNSRIDDPCGSASIFSIGGVAGLVSAGLFSMQGGLFYGGGFALLGTQLVTALLASLWGLCAIWLLFVVLKKTVGLRLPPEKELEGLDLSEHGLISSYNDFTYNIDTTDWSGSYLMDRGSDVTDVQVRKPYVYPGKAETGGEGMLTKIEIIARKEKFEQLKIALNDIGITGMTVFPVSGCGVQKGHNELYRGIPLEVQLKPKIRIEIIVAKVPVADVVNTARHVLYTGHVGDGKIFISTLDDVVRVRTGESGYDAMQGASSE